MCQQADIEISLIKQIYKYSVKDVTTNFCGIKHNLIGRHCLIQSINTRELVKDGSFFENKNIFCYHHDLAFFQFYSEFHEFRSLLASQLFFSSI